MKRRTFLKNSALISVPVILNGNSISALAKPLGPVPFYEHSDKVLVLIQLDGGNDGLNTVIPLDQYSTLYNLRSNIIIPENKILKLNDATGLHPSMSALHNLYQEGQVKLINNVGYPAPNRSHFRSTDIWSSASPSNETWTSGWLGRYLESKYPSFPEGYPNDTYTDPFAITIASRVSETCQGSAANFSMAIANPDNFTNLDTGVEDEVPDSTYGYELNFLRNAIAQTNAYGEVVSKAAELGDNQSPLYDDSNKLAKQLKIVARLISGGLKTSVYVVRMGGFDTHANQVDASDPTIGNHADLLKSISDAIVAFQDDLKRMSLEDRVTGMTFTEFGRQIKSNESFGTDHGEGGPMFLFGSCVNPDILGNNPVIPENPEKRGAVDYQIDFRDIYGSLLMDVFSLSEGDIQNLFMHEFNKYHLVNPCDATNTYQEQAASGVTLSPNPVNANSTINLESTGGSVHIDIINNLGQHFGTHKIENIQAGKHRIPLNINGLLPGIYYCKVLVNNQLTTLKFIKS